RRLLALGQGLVRGRSSAVASGSCERFDASRGEHALAGGAGADERDLYLELALDQLDVAARSCRKRLDRAHVVEGLAPARERLVHRAAVVEVALMRGEVLRLRAVPK